MKKILLPTLILTLLFACSTSRRMEKAVSTGNYDLAIANAINKLKVNKDKKGKEDIILLLEEAYKKANERDLGDIEYLKRDQNPENFIRIYDKYAKLDSRQESVKPLLPLYANGREIYFRFDNYNNEMITYKNRASDVLYNNAIGLLESNNKYDARTAYEELKTIEDINPNYRDVRQLMEVAHQKGTDFVFVEVVNNTEMVIPKRLEDDLLNFSSYGINNFWVVYHNNKDKELNYDFKMLVNLREINISPEQVKERQLVKERQVKDGKKVLLDERGNTVKDSLGNPIEVDRMKTVTCQYYEFTQFKSAQVVGNIEYVDQRSKQLLDAFPLSSEFVFEHVYANVNGDKRALDDALLVFLDNRSVPFPTNEQMVYDCGEDLKAKLKSVINSYAFN